MTNTCFIDIDGVLADFVEAAFILHNIKTPWAEIDWNFVEQAGLDPEKFWPTLDFDFWCNLPLHQECAPIIKAAEQRFGKDNIFLCSSPCQTFGCASGKAMWVDRHLPGYARRLILTNRKEIFSGPNRLLIDDLDENLNKWAKGGGDCILVPRPWNSTHDPRKYVGDEVVQAILTL